MPDTPKRKPKTITAASKAKLPRPKRKRPKTTPNKPLNLPTFEAIPFGTPCHDPIRTDLWEAQPDRRTPPPTLADTWPIALGGIGADAITATYHALRDTSHRFRRWLARRLIRLARRIRPRTTR